MVALKKSDMNLSSHSHRIFISTYLSHTHSKPNNNFYFRSYVKVCQTKRVIVYNSKKLNFVSHCCEVCMYMFRWQHFGNQDKSLFRQFRSKVPTFIPDSTISQCPEKLLLLKLHLLWNKNCQFLFQIKNKALAILNM